MPASVIRWLHLSDFHSGKDDFGQQRIFRYILDHLAKKQRENFVPDFVFMTGDIANRGKKVDYDGFTTSFYQPLIGLLGAGSEDCVYVIPGNHDVDRDQARAVRANGVLSDLPNFLDPTDKGLSEREILFGRFSAYRECKLPPMGANWIASLEGAFTDVIHKDGRRIGIIGLNTAWLSESSNDRHNLTPGKYITEMALEAVGGCDITFILGHHPLDWYDDSEGAMVRALFGRRRTIYLHGHRYRGDSRVEEGAGYTFLSLQCGAAFQARESEIWVNGFTWCELDLNTMKVKAQPLQWSNERQEWRLDSSAFPERFRIRDQWIFDLPEGGVPNVIKLGEQRPS